MLPPFPAAVRKLAACESDCQSALTAAATCWREVVDNDGHVFACASFLGFSSLAIPCFFVAGRRFFADRDRLYAAIE